MALWNNVQCGFSTADETFNFGTRAFAPGSSCIYEASTRATIHSSSEKESLNPVPQILSQMTSNRIIIGIDRTLLVFNQDCDKLEYSTNFELKVTHIIALGGNTLCVSLSDLTIVRIDVDAETQLIFPPSRLPKKALSSQIVRFVALDQVIILVFSSGLLVDLKNIGLEVDFKGEPSMVVEDAPHTLFEEFSLLELSGDISCCTLLYRDTCGSHGMYMCDQESLYNWNEQNVENSLSFTFSGLGKIKKIERSDDQTTIVCLNEDGCLFLLDPYIYCFRRKITDQTVIDFTLTNTVINDPGADKSVTTDVLFLTSQREICLYDLEGRSSRYTLPVTEHMYLVDHQENKDCVMYLEGSGDGAVDSVLIKAVEETVPENRLVRLLQRGRFEEAKKFAVDFHLDQETVLKAEVRWLMGTLPLWNRFSEETLSANYTKMRSILDEIKDVKFVAEVCMKTDAHNVKRTKELIDYALLRLTDKNLKKGELLSTLDQIRDIKLTFETFLKVSGSNPEPDNWLTFSSRNPILICKQFITGGELREAAIVCTRHHSRIKHDLGVEMAINLFESVPLKAPTSVTVEWLGAFVPVAMKCHSQILPRLAAFIERRSRALELHDSKNWPVNAINFVEDCMNILLDCLQSKTFGSSGLQNMPGTPMNILVTFLQNLRALEVLLESHRIRVSFDLYLSSLEDEVAAKEFLIYLFDAVPQDGIQKLISEFVPSFNMHLHKEISSILSTYIVDLMIHYDNADALMIDSYWEARCIMFLNCITVLEEKLTAIVCLAECAQLPWSEKVCQLIDETLLIEHPSVDAVEREKKRLPQKLVLKKYGFGNNIRTDNLMTLISFIYDRNQSGDLSSMLEDGKQLVLHSESNALDPYVCLLLYGIKNKCLDQTMDLIQKELTTLQFDDIKEMLLTILNLELRHEKDRFANERESDYCKDIMTAIDKMSSFSLNHQANLLSAKHMLSAIYLNDNYGTDYEWNNLFGRNPPQIMEECADDLVKRNIDCEDIIAKAVETADRLFLHRNLGLIELADWALRIGKKDIVLKSLTEVCDNNHKCESQSKRITKMLTDSVQHYFSSSAVDKEVVEVLARIARLNIVHSDQDISALTDFLSLCKIYTVKQIKPSWSHHYTDPLESSISFQLGPIVSSTIAQGFPSYEKPVTSVSTHEELVILCQNLPKNLLTLSRIQELCCLLAQKKSLDPATFKDIRQCTILTCRNVIMNILSNPRVPDLNLALILLRNFLPDQILPWLQYVAKHKRDMKFSKNMSLVAKKYCQIHKTVISKEKDLLDASRYFDQLNKVSTWSLRAYNYGIPYKEALADTVEEKMRFLNRLIAVKDMQLSVLETYCRDMGLDVQECYVMYTKHILLSWEPKYTVVKNSSGQSEIIFECNVHSLEIKFQSVMSKIQNSEEVIKKLLKKDFWGQINTYYYEVFSVLLESASSLSTGNFSAYLLALGFLRNYTRIGPIQEEEASEWFSTNPGVSVLPEIAKFRLPYRSCPYSIKMLQTEISLDTYKKWIGAPNFVKTRNIDGDIICSNAIVNLRKTEQVSVNTTWNFQKQNGNLLEKIMDCVDQMSSIEAAVATLYFVVNNVMPPGVDQVEAAQRCYLKADKWRRETRSDEAINKFARAEKKYFTVSTQHILHSTHLGFSKYLSLATEPQRLIIELYEDPQIIKNPTDKNLLINQAVEKIMVLHELDPVKITLELLMQWMHPEAALQTTLNDSIQIPTEGVDEDNIIRACYMLLGNRHLPEIEKYLVGQAFPKNLDDTSKSHGVRFRALRILMVVTTQEQLEHITARDIHTIQSYLQVLDVLNDLERFGLVYTVSDFELTSKELVVNTLLQYNHAPSLRLALKICSVYCDSKPEIMTQILQLMNNTFMIEDLKEVLINGPVSRVEYDVLKSCWNAVMNTAVLDAERDGTCPDPVYVKKVTHLLYTCPDVSFLDLSLLQSFFLKVDDKEVLQFLSHYTNTLENGSIL